MSYYLFDDYLGRAHIVVVTTVDCRTREKANEMKRIHTFGALSVSNGSEY